MALAYVVGPNAVSGTRTRSGAMDSASNEQWTGHEAILRPDATVIADTLGRIRLADMGFLRFRRTLRPLPGVRLNLSKSGVSTSVGTRGAWFTIGHGKTRETVGLPGTGVSYTEQQSIGTPPGDEAAPASSSVGRGVLVWLVAFLVVAVVAIAIFR